MPDLNSRFRLFTIKFKMESERTREHQAALAVEKSRLLEEIKENEKELKELRDSNSETLKDLEAYIQMTGKCVSSSLPGPAILPDLDYLQAIYWHMQPIAGNHDAQQLYELATGGKAWIKQQEKIIELTIIRKRDRLNSIEKEHSFMDAVQQQKAILQSADFDTLIKDIRMTYANSIPTAFLNGTWTSPGDDTTPPFACAWKNTYILPECLPLFKKVTNGYGTDDGRLAIPQIFPNILQIFPDSIQQSNKVIRSVQAFVVAFLACTIPVTERVFWIDAEMMTKASLGVLEPLEGSSISTIPETASDISNLLAKLLALLHEGKLNGRLLIARGVQEIGSQPSHMLQQLIANSENSGFRIILIYRENTSVNLGIGDAISFENDIIWYHHDGKRSICTLPNQIDSIPSSVIDQLKKKAKPAAISTRFTDYVNINSLPSRQKYADFHVEIPYGLLRGQVQQISFWNVDFAGYLLGAAGSGKSTLLHTIIAGITSNYHPDDVELWLADMQNSSFACYARHMPPHIRYLVLDDSVDAITAFIELIYKEHERRNKLRAKAGVEEIWDLPREEVPPRVFVMVDEFGPLSTALSDVNSEKGLKCKTWLTFIMQQGRKNGFHLLFAHQNYISGVRGLEDAAKDQIGLRLLMQANNEEKKACVAISGRTPEQDAILDSIGVHQVAVRSHGKGLPKDRCLTQPAQVLYLDDNSMEQIGQIADWQRREMTYIPKNPVVVDQSHRITFSSRKEAMNNDIEQHKNAGLVLYLGSPRNMSIVQHTMALRKMNQSYIVLCDVMNSDDRLRAVKEVFMAAIGSCNLQNAKAEIWESIGNPLSNKMAEIYGNKSCFFRQNQIHERIDELFTLLQDKQEANRMILIPDLPNLLSQLNDMEEEEKLLGKTQNKEQEPLSGEQELQDLVNAFRLMGASQPASQENSFTQTEKLLAIIRAGPKYGTVVFACANKDTSVFPKPLKEEWFMNKLLFRSGYADYSLAKIGKSLHDDDSFIYIGSSDQTLYTTYQIC